MRSRTSRTGALRVVQPSVCCSTSGQQLPIHPVLPRHIEQFPPVQSTGLTRMDAWVRRRRHSRRRRRRGTGAGLAFQSFMRWNTSSLQGRRLPLVLGHNNLTGRQRAGCSGGTFTKLRVVDLGWNMAIPSELSVGGHDRRSSSRWTIRLDTFVVRPWVTRTHAQDDLERTGLHCTTPRSAGGRGHPQRRVRGLPGELRQPSRALACRQAARPNGTARVSLDRSLTARHRPAWSFLPRHAARAH